MKETPKNNNQHKKPKKTPISHHRPPTQSHNNQKAADSSLIDDIFKSAKHKKIVKQQSIDPAQIKQKRNQEKLKKQWKIQEKLRKSSQGVISSASKTSDAVKIYSEEELKLGKGGNTSKCPIDCDCCF